MPSVELAEDDGMVDIILPDFFTSFLQQEPRVNPLYKQTKSESEQWLGSFCSFDPVMQKKVNRCDFSYFCAITTRDAPRDRFKTICDWGNWVFPYDDMFDHGDLRADPELARATMHELVEGMKRPVSEKDGSRSRIIEAHDDVFRRVAEGSDAGIVRRFVEAMTAYAAGALHHIDDVSTHRLPTLDEMIATRRLSSGVTPLYALVEFGHELKIPDYVFDDPAIKQLQVIGTDFVAITNDILSYMKVERENVPHNMVAVSRMRGLAAQDAFDEVSALLETRYNMWDNAVSRVPRWNSSVDDQVAQYIEGIKNVVRANLYWSYKSERYLGKDAAQIRQTRRVRVLREPSFGLPAVGA